MNKKTSALQDSLDQMSTQQLDEILVEEIQKERVDERCVRQILRVLEQREEDKPAESNAEIERVWEQYRKSVGSNGSGSKSRWGGGLLRAASIFVIVGLLVFALPQVAEANNFIEMLAKWSDSVYSLFGKDTTNNQHMEYVFKTDNPGLQEVYDAVVELGVTEPVVPMWLPEGYELVECKPVKTPTKSGLMAEFVNETYTLIFKVDLYSENISREYEKDGTQVKTAEIGDMTFHIMRNNDMWVVVWTKERVECFLTIDCSEEALYRMLESIYTTEVE